MLKFKNKGFCFLKDVHVNYNFNWIIFGFALIIFDVFTVLQFTLVGIFLDSIITFLFGFGKFLGIIFIFIYAFLKILGIKFKSVFKLKIFYLFLLLSTLFFFSNIVDLCYVITNKRGFVVWKGNYFVFGIKNYFSTWLKQSVFLRKQNYYLSFTNSFWYGGGFLGAFFAFLFAELSIIVAFICAVIFVIFAYFWFFKIHFQIKNNDANKLKQQLTNSINHQQHFENKLTKTDKKLIIMSQEKEDKKHLSKTTGHDIFLNRAKLQELTEIRPMGKLKNSNSETFLNSNFNNSSYLNKKEYNFACLKIKNFEHLYKKGKLYAFENQNISDQFLSQKLKVDLNVAKIILYFLIQEKIVNKKTTKW